MSGFLHRLAALAIGSGNSTLHSVARLPYAIPPSPVYNEESGGQSATLGALGNKRPPIANSAAELNHGADQNQPHGGFHAKIDAQDRNNEIIPSSPEALIAQSATGFTTTSDLEIAAPSSVRSLLRQPETRVKNTAAGESAVSDGVIKTHSPLNNSGTNPIVHDEPYATLTDSAVPQPLLPLKNTAHSSALNAGAVAQRGEPRGSAWQSQVEETTEVHVSIGRIEVTAVHEAPPPKRQTPATAKPMTLDEYLARRQRQA